MGLAHVYSGSLVPGLHLCEEAAGLLRSTGDAEDPDASLALAEALIDNGKLQKGLDAALFAQKQFNIQHRIESEWKAWTIAAYASQRLLLEDNARDAISNARLSLQRLRQKWGEEAFGSYSSRSDILVYLKRLDEG
jgi:hypothetical protein